MPSQENEKAMDGLLRRSLARDSRASGDCPEAELLAAYFDQSLGADEAAGYELHFSQCARCREQLAAMARAGAEQSAAPALEPALVNARAAQPIALGHDRIAAHAKPSAPSSARSEVKAPLQRSPDSRWFHMRWLIPVAAVLVLSAVVFMRFASHGKIVGLENQVAMSKSAPPPQEQTAPEPEKKSADVAVDKSTPKNEPSAAGTPSNPQSTRKSAASSASTPESTRVQRGEGTSLRAGTTSRGASTATTWSSQGTAHGAAGRASALQSQKQSGGVTAGAASQQYSNAASEAAPAAPAPELNASMPAIVVATDSADAVKSPAPAPPPSAQQKSRPFGLAGKFNDSPGTKSLAKEIGRAHV